MLASGFVLSNLTIFLAWFLFVGSRRSMVMSDLLPYAGLMMGAQIVLSEIALGSAGLLSFAWLVSLNLAVSLAVLTWLHFSEGRLASKSLRQALSQLSLRGNWPGWENLTLIVLLAFLTTWIAVAVYFLPPRGIDDLTYHLPPLYEYVGSHRISLLPLELRNNFAMPLGGDFLFLWPMVFFHSDRIIDGVQWVVALYGISVLYGLARQFEVPRRDALFVSMLFAATPVILGQAGSNYVDVIVAVCHLVLMYASVRFWKTGALSDLLFLGVASGFGIGIKYNMLPAVLAIQPIIMLRFWRDGNWWAAVKRYGLYAAAAGALGLFWLVRNYLETGLPLYPYELGFGGLKFSAEAYPPPYSGLPMGFLGAPLGWFFGEPASFFRYLFDDPGLGSFHGGFGVIFWALGFPAMIYCTYLAMNRLRRKEFFPLVFWVQAWLAYAVFLSQAEYSRLIYNQRLIIVVVGFGLLAAGIMMGKLRSELPRSVNIIRLLCLSAAGLFTIQMAGYAWPTYQVKDAVTDWSRNQQTSEYKYYRNSPWGLPLLSAAWEPLDYLTRSGPGWDVYMAVQWDLFWTAPTYGSRVQNRIWNFIDEPERDPDALIFHGGRDKELFYVGRKITRDQIANDDRYELATIAPATEFWVRRDLLARPETRERLMTFYQRASGGLIDLLTPLVDDFPDDAILITSAPLGHAMKYLSMTGALRIPVRLVPAGQERYEAFRASDQKIVTIGAPLKGFKSRALTEMRGPDGWVGFFENVAP